MKNLLLLAAMSALAVCASAQTLDNPRLATMDLSAKELAHYMAPGWNLGNTMEAGSSENIDKNAGIGTETSWQGTKTTQQIIDCVKSAGFRSVRIPCAWVMGHVTDSGSSTIDAQWVSRVKEVVDYCMKTNLYVVLNDHWDGGWLEDSFDDTSDATVKKNTEKLKRVWTQIAEAFKQYDQRLVFAGLNEPAHSNSSQAASYIKALKAYEQAFVDAVRATGGNNSNRVLVVQGPATNIQYTHDTFGQMPQDAARDRLMLEVHSYDPYQFCLMEEDADWGSLWYYWGTGHTLKGAGKRNATSNESDLAANYSLIKQFTDKGIPAILGEYGANRRDVSSIKGQKQSTHDESISFWYEQATMSAMNSGMVPFVWDTNVLSSPSMTIIDRAKASVYNWKSKSAEIQVNGALEGLMRGVEAGKAAYNKYYPEPSATAISSVEANAASPEAFVYTVMGVAVGGKTSSFPADKLPKGVYVFKGKKYAVR